MSNTNTGGPAFPCDRIPTQSGGVLTSDGMTLRDYFAARAMLPLMAHSGGYWDDDKLKQYAVTSYAMADAMLKARGT